MVWKEVPGFPDYEASTTGEIRRATSRTSGRAGQLKVPLMLATGYRQQHLYRDGQRFPIKVCRIIAMTFHGPAPPGCEVSHLNGNRSDDRAANLRWESRQENEDRKEAHGTRLRGQRVATAVLTDEDVREIKRLLPSQTQTAIAERFGVSISTVNLIKTGKTWRHI